MVLLVGVDAGLVVLEVAPLPEGPLNETENEFRGKSEETQPTHFPQPGNLHSYGRSSV
jgi:hypothetical protein